ncbi:ABC transporter substrate-binding protein [Brevibacterium sediminis]|uniref:ABC transporter substrate-binding protein n=1 Tax=Brevibacterium sediminis TaxID=1857024 RepID=UPI003B3B4991
MAAISKKQGGLLAAVVVVLALIAGGVIALVNVRGSEASAEPGTEDSVAASSEFDLSSKNADGRPHIDPVPEAVAALKKSGFTPVRDGKLTVVGTGQAGGAPLGVLASDDNKTRIGVEADFAQLIAEGLGLDYQQAVTSWADWPLGIQSGKYDLVTSNVTVTDERKRLYDFSSYRTDLLGFYVKSDSPIDSIKDADDASGLKIIVSSGTNQEQVLLTWNKRLEKEGKDPAELVYYDDDSAATLAIQSGRADATFGPNPTGAFKAAVNGETKRVGTLNGGWPKHADIAAATKKGNGLITPVNIVLNHAIENGQYAEILKRWGLEDEAVEKSVINPPGLPESES